jgi:tetratricopeptide (TPR) repeat protein
MKFKPLYIYLVAAVVILALIVIGSLQSSEPEAAAETQQNPHGNMPEDDIHGQLGSGSDMPSGSNVRADIIQKMNDLKEYVEENPDDTVKIKEYADLLGSAHKLDEAMPLYDRLLELNPNRVDVLLIKGFLYYKDGNLDDAQAATRKILDIDPTHANAKYNIGAIAIARGDTSKAIEVWKDIVDKHPNSQTAGIAQRSLTNLGVE